MAWDLDKLDKLAETCSRVILLGAPAVLLVLLLETVDLLGSLSWDVDGLGRMPTGLFRLVSLAVVWAYLPWEVWPGAEGERRCPDCHWLNDRTRGCDCGQATVFWPRWAGLAHRYFGLLALGTALGTAAATPDEVHRVTCLLVGVGSWWWGTRQRMRARRPFFQSFFSLG